MAANRANDEMFWNTDAAYLRGVEQLREWHARCREKRMAARYAAFRERIGMSRAMSEYKARCVSCAQRERAEAARVR